MVKNMWALGGLGCLVKTKSEERRKRYEPEGEECDCSVKDYADVMNDFDVYLEMKGKTRVDRYRTRNLFTITIQT
jgi:hypothetical protein